MNLLLDTHTFIWWDSNPAKIPADTINLLKKPDNQVFLSLASLWEIQNRDPFDRLLIAQSRVEGAAIATRDELFQRYACQTI